uniref:DNA 5'-3' helicase n=1 Tax=Bangiopsis subsimplex TaxID=139980 RepID=A0A1C9CCU9_9RHOD|nr:replication helicase subunit [Bangiopsis subsimplex]AOM66218.1 replication helicase subunit [Bangiopsis subsimplex]ARO90421.1 replication helicase subunit [Bangiopsis subsimplex]
MIFNHTEEFLFYNPYAEELILRAMIVNNCILDYILSEVDEDFFYLNNNKIIFKAIRQLYIANENLSPFNICYQLDNEQLLSKAGGQSRILNMAQCNLNLSQLEVIGYIAILKDKLIKRLLYKISIFIQEMACSYEIYNAVNLSKIENELAKIIQVQSNSKISKITDLIQANFRENYFNYTKISTKKISTGFSELDEHLEILDKGNLIIVAGRPAMGKTSFGLSLIMNICKQKPKASIIIFSLEMTASQIANRLMVIETDLPLQTLRNIFRQQKNTIKLSDIFPNIYQSSIYIDDNNSINPEYIQNTIQKIITKDKEIDLILIDYLQLLGKLQENRTQEISYITRNLKKVARQFNVPIILLSQLNRNVEQRKNKRPLLSDLRESGCIKGNAIIQTDILPHLVLESLTQKKFSLLSTIFPKSNYNKITFSINGKSCGRKHIYAVIKSKKFMIQLTANHRIFTLYNWQRIDILVEDSIIITNKLKKWCYYKVENLIYCQKEKIYNLKVPPFSNFIANSIIVHNSIEQDADVVLLLYRESYYNSLSNNNTTEIIIGKNRNGTTGSIFLNFNAKTTKFV